MGMERWKLGSTIDDNSVVGLQILVHDHHHHHQNSGRKTSIIRKSTSRWSIGPIACQSRQSAICLPESGFLRACHLCHTKLSPEKDVYIYRGDQAYCSLNCRHKQIFMDEMSEKEALLVRKRVSSSPLPCNSSSAAATKPHHRRRNWAAA